MTFAVGVDVGGTFTDLAAISDDGRIATAKVLTRPADQSEGVLDALGASGLRADSVGRIVHGTTVVTNLLLERTGARVVLCATEGHTDVLRLRRQDRARLYDLAAHHPPPLVVPDDTVGVAERMGPDGVVRALDASGIADAVAAVRARTPDAVAIVLLHAYAHDAHERALADALAAALPDGVPVVRSSAVFPEPREYERAATAVAEAYARPRVAHYVRRLGERLAVGGYPAPGVMTSGGGVLRADEAAESAAALALSGPAGGVAGAAAVLAALGIRGALTLDVGGTSADVGLVLDGEPLVEAGGSVAGVPIALPRVLVDTVSAGGGSVAWVDDGGALRVGPRSAGAVPGPAAFGRGGVEATVTDAQVVLERLAPSRMSGSVAIDPARAWSAVAAVTERLDGRAGDAARVRAVAAGIIAAADAEMARALRRVSVERGVDPRGLVLVAFGGGGPLHACGLAERLGVTRVLVPPHAGVLSAVGLAAAPDRREALVGVATVAAALSAQTLGALVARGAARTGAGAERRTWARARYVGQGAELDVPVYDGEDGDALAARFAAAHARRAGFTLDRAVEVVSLRHAASTPGMSPVFARRGVPAEADGEPRSAPGDAVARIDDAFARTDDVVPGPAAITLADATVHVPGGWTARALAIGGWMVEVT